MNLSLMNNDRIINVRNLDNAWRLIKAEKGKNLFITTSYEGFFFIVLNKEAL